MGQDGEPQPIDAPIHQGAITACAFMGSADRLATASVEGAIAVWEVPAGRVTRRIAAHRGPIMALAWDARRRRLISAGHDRRILSHDPDGAAAAEIGRHAAGVYALAISPSGEVLASAGYGGPIKLWRLTDASMIGELPGHAGATLDLDFLDDDRLASVGRDYDVVVWDVAAGAERLRIRGHRRWVMRVRAAAEGQVIYSAGEDQQVCAWAADTGAPLWRTRFPSPVWGLERSADGAALIVGTGGLAARLDLGPESASEPRPISSDTARAICRSDAGLMALGCADKVILYRADAPHQPSRRIELGAPLHCSVAAVRRSPERGDEVCAVMGAYGGEIDLDVGGERRRLSPGHRALAFACCFVAPSLFATTGFDGLIQLRSAADGALVSSLDHGGFIFSVAASADGARLLAVGNDSMSLWDVASGAEVWRGEALGVGFHVWGTLSPDASCALAAGEGPALHRWDFSEAGVRQTRLDLDFGQLIGTCGLMAIVQIDAASAAVGTAGGEVRRVDLASGRSRLLHAEHESGVRAMALSPDGRRLLSFSENGTTRLYDLEQGRLCTPPAIAEAVVPAACFTPDGDLVWVDGVGRLGVLPA